MSRIQQILDKAEREGRMRRTTSGETAPASPASPPPPAPPAPASPSASTAFASLPPAETRVAPAREAVSQPGFELPPRIAAVRARQGPAPAPPSAQPAMTPAAPTVPSPVLPPARKSEARLHRLLVAAMHPHSASAEQYRALRTRIAQAENTRQYRAILVTSPAQGDGKSVTSANLAFAMAQEFHRRILLVDGDLRNSSLHRLLGIPGRPGLSDVLLGEAALEDALVSLAEHRLTVLPAGTRVDRATELLGSAEMRRLMDALRTQFDRIILDTPPASPLADVGVLEPLVDGVLVVVRAGYTQRPAIDRALEDIDPGRVLGLVLNDVDEGDIAYSYGAAPKGPAQRHGDRRTA